MTKSVLSPHAGRRSRWTKSGHDDPELDPGIWFSIPSSPKHKEPAPMIRKLASGKYRLYSRKKDSKTGKRCNLGTFGSRAAVQKHERAVQYFKRFRRSHLG